MNESAAPLAVSEASEESEALTAWALGGGDDFDLQAEAAAAVDVCEGCGFPLESFKHRAFLAKGLTGHEVVTEEKKPAKAKASK